MSERFGFFLSLQNNKRGSTMLKKKKTDLSMNLRDIDELVQSRNVDHEFDQLKSPYNLDRTKKQKNPSINQFISIHNFKPLVHLSMILTDNVLQIEIDLQQDQMMTVDH